MVWKTPIILGVLGCSALRQVDVDGAIESAEGIESRTVHWNLCSGEGPAEHSSNLAGQGPDSDTPAEFRIKKIAEWFGVNLDLVVTVAAGETYSSWMQRLGKGGLGAYVSPSPHVVGSRREEPAGPPCWAIIPVEVNTRTKFNFKFVKSDTSEVVVIDNFSMKFVEFDNERDNWNGKGPDREYLEFNTAVATCSPGAKVHESVTDDGLRRIESTESGRWTDNPSFTGPRGGCSPVGKDPYSCLHDYQEDRSVTVSYTKIGEWDLTFGHEVPESTRFDRVIEFYGSMHPPSCKWVPWKFCDGSGPTAFSSNLAGQGPDAGAHEFRIKAIAEVEGITLDLVLTVAQGETYKSKYQRLGERGRGAYVSPSKGTDRREPDGPPCWAVLPIEVNTHTKFNWKLVKTSTSEVQVVKHFKLTVVEFDNENNNWDWLHGSWWAGGWWAGTWMLGPDREYLDFNTVPSGISKGAKVHESWQHGVRRIESTEEGVWQDNPTFTGPRDGCIPSHDDPYSCLRDNQAERRVDVEYKELGEWQITFGHHAPKEPRDDRVLEFYGSTGFGTCE